MMLGSTYKFIVLELAENQARAWPVFLLGPSVQISDGTAIDLGPCVRPNTHGTWNFYSFLFIKQNILEMKKGFLNVSYSYFKI